MNSLDSSQESLYSDFSYKNLHDFIYELVSIICYDKDYLYLLFYKSFTELMNDIYDKGRANDSGTYVIKGNKSNMDISIKWFLSGRVNFIGYNTIRLECVFTDKRTFEILETCTGIFDLSTGEVA